MARACHDTETSVSNHAGTIPSPGAEPFACDRFRPTSTADLGLICAFAFSATTPARRADIAEYPGALAEAGTVLWYHLNAAHAGARRWLLQCDVLPDVARAAMESRDERCRIEPAGDGLLVVLNDLTFEARADPDEVSRLWAYVTPQMVLTLRAHPLLSTDRLRSEAREGLRIASGPALLCRLMEYQITRVVTQLPRELCSVGCLRAVSRRSHR